MKSRTYIYSFLLLLLILPACSDWLNVSSNSEIVAEEQFKSEAGYRDALTGVYILLTRPALYGQNMTWRCVEFLSQQYMVVAGAADITVPRYEYDGVVLTNYGERIWLSQYNAIANINNILKWRESTGNVMHPVQDSIITGECLALRAYCHLDLMRLYGKGGLENRRSAMNELTVPYQTEYSKNIVPMRSYTETFKLLFNDLEEALRYLEADPIKSLDNRTEGYYDPIYSDGFIETDLVKRRIRMNYYSCLALYARALMWEGSDESRAKALQIARQIINPDIDQGTDYYQWVKASDLVSDDYLVRDNSFMYEHLWSLYIDNFVEYQKTTYNYSWFAAHSPNNMYDVAFLSDARAKYVYEIDEGITSDWRYTKGLMPEGSSLNNYSILKFRDQEPESERKSKTYRNRMPLLRISEMFYIAAECLADSDPVEALRYLNTVRHKRNIPENMDLTGLSPQQIREEITKEYMKEFVAEGQLFFYYKRKNFQNIYGYAEDMNDSKYVFPLPQDEVINGHREQTEIN